jgi:transposase
MTSQWTLTFLLSSAETIAGKPNQMSTPQKEVAISLFEDGENQRRIAEILGVSQSGVSKFLKRFNQRESCENERRSGRPRKTDDRGDIKILRCVKTDRRQSLTEITNNVFK